MLIYLLRHGLTEYNAQKRYQGQRDIPLSPEGLAQLRRAFPTSMPALGDFTVSEPSDYPDSGASGYQAIHRDSIDPIEQAWKLSLRIGLTIANEFGAHG